MNWFKRTMVVGAVAAAVLLTGCAPAPQGNASRSSGSLALSSDDAVLYAVDTDNGVLAVIPVATPDQLTRITVGQSPVRVVLGPDDTAYVANRGSNTVSVIRKGAKEVSATLETALEPSGLALSADGRQLLVTCNAARDTAAHGVLLAFDTATLQQQWELPVGEEPRAVAVVAGNKALVSLYKKGEVATVDLSRQAVTSDPSRAQVYTEANATRTTGTPTRTGTTVSTFHPRAAADIITTPDGTRAFTPVVWAREGAISRRPSSAGGYYSAGGPCSIGAVATAGIVTYDTRGAQPEALVDDLTACASSGTNTNDSSDFPVSTFSSSRGGAEAAVQGPTVGVTDPTGAWVFIVNRESQNVAILPVDRRSGTDLDFERTGTSIRTLVRVGPGADGIAISKDGTRAFVYSQFNHQVETLVAKGRGDSAVVVNTNTPITVAGEKLSAEVAAGRKLFFDAIDPKVSSAQTNVACSTCHLEGREDGHVWMFPDGPRQTPALAGRDLLQTAPFHWSGEFPTIGDFNVHTIRERMGGVGLNAADAARLDQFISGLPTAPAPLAKQADAVVRGRAAFEKAQCATCHAGELLTDNSNRDVGTVNTRSAVANERDNGIVMLKGFNVPSLKGLARSAPYLHDGSEATLEVRVFGNAGDKHGTTSTLSEGEKTDLVSYLKSL
ncbi:MAG: c-type cytochrome [Myxococcus sp.]|nr:c-type cytochrome [Myxococcus sp.]